MSQFNYTPLVDGPIHTAADHNIPFSQVAAILNGGIASDNIAVGGVSVANLASGANPETRQRRNNVNYVVSGGTIATSGTLSSTITAMVAYNNGKEQTPGSFPKTFTASKDTYVDEKDDGTYAFVEVANGATTGMTLTTNSDASSALRIAKVVTSGTAVTSVVQTGWDSLGNAIFNGSPVIISLGYAQITANFSNTTTPAKVDVTGLTTTVIVPPGGRRIKVTFGTAQGYTSNAGNYFIIDIVEDGTVIGTGTYRMTAASADESARTVICSKIPTSGSHTYKIQVSQTTAGTMLIQGLAASPAFILVEAI